jgi:hypothetical protein
MSLQFSCYSTWQYWLNTETVLYWKVTTYIMNLIVWASVTAHYNYPTGKISKNILHLLKIGMWIDYRLFNGAVSIVVLI